MKRLFLDCEFNGLGGQLISMALVDAGTKEWYETVPIIEEINPWVAEHVVPFIHKEPIKQTDFLASLAAFLKDYDGCEIIADWPADFEHLCSAMTSIGAEDEWCIPISCTMRLQHSGELAPKIPHNALSDARALRDWYLKSAAIAA